MKSEVGKLAGFPSFARTASSPRQPLVQNDVEAR